MKNSKSIPVSRSELILAIVLVFGSIYFVMQQNNRAAANDTPMQYALSARYALVQGQPPATVVSSIPAEEMAHGIAPFIMVYDKDGRLLATSATLHGTWKPLPPGVLEAAGRKTEYAVSWQPEKGVRNAMVVLPYFTSGRQGFVAAGQSLKESEKRTNLAMAHVLVCLVASIFILYVVSWLRRFLVRMPG